MEATTATVPPRTNLERFQAATNGSIADYQAWASQVGRKMHIGNLDRTICERMGIYTVAHLAQLPTPLPDGIDTEEQEHSYLLEHSTNPLELARMWQTARFDAEMHLSIEVVLSMHLRPFPKENFERWGDRNCLGDVSKSWFKKTGLELDVQIQEILEIAPVPVSIEDAIAFVKSWKPNGYVSPPAWLQARIEERFQSLTGFRIKDYYAEHLMRSALINHPALTDDVPF
ncbi:hypothetical protein [Fibrella aquatilis]|uniref:Uncharacterized protein n=1 Tax=Fibrella aquatilis TaxID=2817059 RepID=A0A939GCL2_9BACT|nr:hypothetical protein [Fibrella aquatilis]MBO0933918.1 hypothetical protein [Fibrella aquatilis]